MTDIFPTLCFILVVVGYSIFAALLATHSSRQRLPLLMAVAAAATAVWSGVLLVGRYGYTPIWSVSLAAMLRDASWFTVIFAISDRPTDSPRAWNILIASSVGLFVLHGILLIGNFSLGTVAGVHMDATVTGLLVIILGYTLVENLARNSSRDKFWGVKYLVIGMLAILTLQLFIRVPEFLTHEPSSALVAVSPLIYLLVLPLFVLTAARSPAANLQIHSSRRIVFHTTTLVIAGIALQGTAGAAYFLRNYGGDNGTALAIVFVITAFLACLVIVTSSTMRSHLRKFINENFFSYKYDYRAEWTKFIMALSAVEEDGIPLRVLRTFADLMDCPGGALWVWKDSFRQYLPMAKWSVCAELKPIALSDPLLAVLRDTACTLVDLTNVEESAKCDRLKAEFPDIWLVVPLRYRSQLVGIAFLCKPRSHRSLDWEDRSLVSLVAMQLAVYLVHNEAAQALLDNQQMEEFNRRFAFLAHDMKNTIGQLDLLARNAEKFADRPDFQKDMNITLRNSVDKLNALLSQIRGEGSPGNDNIASAGNKDVSVVELLTNFIDGKKRLGLPVAFVDGVSPADGRILDDRVLINVLEHVVANALEVTPQDALVEINLSSDTNSINIEVNDVGPGMSQQFINEQLFRPFKTTKQHGFGIGAYQARENVRKLGGTFEVRSTMGFGTSVVISLPCSFKAAQNMARP